MEALLKVKPQNSPEEKRRPQLLREEEISVYNSIERGDSPPTKGIATKKNAEQSNNRGGMDENVPYFRRACYQKNSSRGNILTNSCLIEFSPG